MTLPEAGYLLRIFVGESDQWEGRSLYEAIVQKARQMGLAGATLLKGFEGFGAHSRIHTTRILRLSEDLPVLIELVDTKDKIDSLLKEIDPMIDEGLVTLEKVKILKYRHRGQGHGKGNTPHA
jgi:PII-like signaling protein